MVKLHVTCENGLKGQAFNLCSFTTNILLQLLSGGKCSSNLKKKPVKKVGEKNRKRVGRNSEPPPH